MSHRHLFRTSVAAASLLLAACDRGTAPDSPGVVSYQIPGCAAPMEKRSPEDSCFSWHFRDALLVDFCAEGNCCPDSNRFVIRHIVQNGTITVTIADTAAQLCRCNCSYMLHVEFQNLTRDSYYFVCRREDALAHEVLSSAWVHRTTE